MVEITIVAHKSVVRHRYAIDGTFRSLGPRLPLHDAASGTLMAVFFVFLTIYMSVSTLAVFFLATFFIILLLMLVFDIIWIYYPLLFIEIGATYAERCTCGVDMYVP